MKKFKLWHRIGVVALALFTIGLSVFFAHPSDATSARNQEMLSLGLIDGVKTPQELGLGYLSEQPELIAGETDLLDAIRRVPQELSQTISNGGANTPLAIPLGTNSPIAIGRMRDEGQLRDSNYEGVGVVGADGQAKSITPISVSGMANQEALSSDGNLTMTPEAQEVLVADASGMFAQRRRVPTIDLIARDRLTNNFYLVPRVNANAFCRDNVNAVLNRTLRRLDSRVGRPTRSRPVF